MMTMMMMMTMIAMMSDDDDDDDDDDNDNDDIMTVTMVVTAMAREIRKLSHEVHILGEKVQAFGSVLYTSGKSPLSRPLCRHLFVIS